MSSSGLKLRKAVIPAAGLGTRFLPVTKVVPKELLPIVDKPSIQYIVSEAVHSGIDEIVFVTGRGKHGIVDFFDPSRELQEKFEREGKTDLLETLRGIDSAPNLITVRQSEPKGLGHAVLCAKDVIGDEPFAVLLGDDLIDSVVPCVKQMADVYEKYGKSVVALMSVPDEDVPRFGICGGSEREKGVYELDEMVEKPALEDAPSSLAIVGRYVLSPGIFGYLESTPPGRGGEIQLTDAMASMMREEGFIGYEFSGDRYDAGDKFGFLQANIAYSLKREDMASRLRAYLREIL